MFLLTACANTEFFGERIGMGNPREGFCPIQGKYLFRKSVFLERRRRLKIRSLERMLREEAVSPTVENEGWHLPLEVQVFVIGKQLAILGLPGEQFVEHALHIKWNTSYSGHRAN